MCRFRSKILASIKTCKRNWRLSIYNSYVFKRTFYLKNLCNVFNCDGVIYSSSFSSMGLSLSNLSNKNIICLHKSFAWINFLRNVWLYLQLTDFRKFNIICLLLDCKKKINFNFIQTLKRRNLESVVIRYFLRSKFIHNFNSCLRNSCIRKFKI